ncbi:MAG TPA: GAF domain-containing SpoIIE family protein phosphatase [Terriglobales bacterium]|jgi:sigma-B regulation protein RsbU (phosphoserine phosphatase)|nr:GAF domain-containing SpoIIE family protein phosphatase [Terriglobales bacterium]
MAASPNLTAPLPTNSGPLNLDQVEDLLKLQRAAQKISSILDLDQLVDKVVNEVARSFGCLDSDIYLHNEERGELSLVCAHGCTGCDLHGPGHSLKIGKGMVGYVASTGQMHYAPDVRLDQYYIGCEESTLSEVAIPLHVEGQLVGVFTASHTELDAFNPCQLRLLQALCSDVAVAVHNARRFQQEQRQREQMTREAREARVIQQALLPKASPTIPGFTVSGLSIPAGAVGGDWYDFIPMDKGRWGLVLADVSGKGTAAALLMSATRGILRSLVEAACTPGEVLTKLNRLLVEDFPAGRFVTMVYAVLDPAKRTLTFANAGHLRPLLMTGNSAQFLDVERGIPLGLGPGDFSETEVNLPTGSRLLFYSDGITEAENPADEEYGSLRLQEHFLRTDASAESLLDDVRSFADGAGLRDDASVILVKG